METFMKVMDTVFYPFTAFMDWAYKNDIGAVGELTGFTAILCAYAAAVASPFMIKAHFNGKALDRTCKALDNTATKTFNVAADKSSYSEFQKQAVENAHKQVNKMGNGLSYSSEKSCAERHKDYTERTYTVMQPMMVGKVTTMIPRTVTEFNPHIIGYQVANDNAELAMPLYSSTRDGYGIRPDGAEIALL